MGLQRMCGCVWEKKGLTCYQADARCVRAGEYINGLYFEDLGKDY